VINRFMTPGPWITRDLKSCVLASDYDVLVELLQRIDEHTFNCPYSTICCPDCAKLRNEILEICK
jgi:hypothetical protein